MTGLSTKEGPNSRQALIFLNLLCVACPNLRAEWAGGIKGLV